MSIKKFLKDKSGAAIVYIVVAAAILVLLGAATTTTAYVNLKATQVEKNSENNFYNADAIMNLITAGFERDMSVAYDAALTRYLADPTMKGLAHEVAQEKFAEIFFEQLLAQGLLLSDTDNRDFDNMYYNLEHIQNYVRFSLATSAVNRDDLRYTITAVNGYNYIDKIDNGRILRNLHVTYESDTGYFDEITTDIKITCPDVPTDTIPTPTDTIMLFHQGIEVNSTKGATVRGDAYVGADENGNALLLQDSSSLKIMSPIEAAIKGEIKTIQNNRLTLCSSHTTGAAEDWANKIYTENINLGKSTVASIIGRIYVLDDLEVNGSNTSVTLKGDYWGYSHGNTKASDSSSININGANTTLNITELQSLTLAGASYIDVHVIESGSYETNTGELSMGESFSVKSNQIAYLVDDKEFTTIGAPAYNKAKNFVSNPMSEEQYKKLINGTSWEQVQNNILNAPLSYGKSYKEFGVNAIKRVWRQDGTVHLYLEFKDEDSASTFFTTVYKGNGLMSQRLRAYAAEYISLLEISSNTKLYVNENYIDPSVALYTEAKIFNDGFNYSKNPADEQAMNVLCNSLKEEYLGNATIEGVKEKNTFDKIVDVATLRSFMSTATKASTDKHTNTTITTSSTKDKKGNVTNVVILQGSTDAKAILIDNEDSTEPYVITGGSGVIICTGDLEIKGDWMGTILCGGRTYIIGGSKEVPINITFDSKTIADTLALYYVTGKDSTDRKAHGVANVLIEYADYQVKDATIGEGNSTDRINQNLTFTNWDRQ